MHRFHLPILKRGKSNRAGLAQVLSEGLSRCEGGQWASGAAVVRERLYVDSGLAVVLDDGLLGRGASSDEGSGQGGCEELHCDLTILGRLEIYQLIEGLKG